MGENERFGHGGEPHFAVCGNLVPQPGMEPVLPAMGAQSLTTGPPEKSQLWFSVLKLRQLRQWGLERGGPWLVTVTF